MTALDGNEPLGTDDIREREPTYFRCWLDGDGNHIWVSHLCSGTLSEHMLPHPQWSVAPSSGGQISPSFSCSDCGTHAMLWLDTVGGTHPLVMDAATVLGGYKRLTREVDRLRAELGQFEGHDRDREQRAAAWDEGYESALTDVSTRSAPPGPNGPSDPTRNPYREANDG